MYWLWKWLESYNNCTFWTWKDKCLFNLLFWIPNSFSTFYDYGRGGTPSLASPDGTSLIFYHSEFLSNLRLPWKTEFALNFFTVLQHFLSFRIFKQIALIWKQSLPWKFSLYWIYFSHSRFFSNLRLPWKESLPWTFSLYWIYFSHSGFLSNVLLHWKTVCPEVFTVLKCSLSFRIFEQLALALKTEFALEFFTALNIFFYHLQEFWATLRFPWKT